MKISEADARPRWCPFSGTRDPNARNWCLGPSCMAWIAQRSVERSAGKDRPDGDGWNEIPECGYWEREVPSGFGACGLIGGPQ